MEFIVSMMLIVKILAFVIMSSFLAFVVLFPMNDQPTSRTQVAVWLVLELVLSAAWFGFVSFRISA